MKNLLILVGSGGGGHTATARALRDACHLARKNYEFQTVDVSELLGITVGDAVYNWLLVNGRARWIPTWHYIGRVLGSLNSAKVTGAFRADFAQRKFDAVISCVPFLNSAVAAALATFNPQPALITIMSDFDNSVDHPWAQDHRQHIICGTENALRQVEALGHPSERLYGTTGMLVHQSFYQNQFRGTSRSAALAQLKLNPGYTTACIYFGGYAPHFVGRIIEILGDYMEPLNIIVMCGKNVDVLEQVHEIALTTRGILPVGFTDNAAFYMQLSDFLIGKPGPGVISEAMVCGLPVIVEMNEDHTPPQECAVAEWISAKGVGVVLPSFEALPFAVDPGTLRKCKENIRHVPNRAVFEIPHIVDGILKLSEQRERRIASAMGVLPLSPPMTPRSPTGSEGSDGTSLASSSSRTRSSCTSLQPLHERNSISLLSSSYLDYAQHFPEPIRLGPEMCERRMLINASSSSWGHDVIYCTLTQGVHPDAIEVIFSAGYLVTWFKELAIFTGNRELARMWTRNEEHGPREVLIKADALENSILRLDFYKAGFLGIHTLGYRRFLDISENVGCILHILWDRERFATSLPNS